MSTKSSYNQILKSTSIMGGVAGINLILGMIRTKISAILIGLSGAGLNSGFLSIQGLVSTISGLGIQSSAVREIALISGSNDGIAIGKIIITLRRICILTGLAGMIIMIALSSVISKITFGNTNYKLDIALLGIVILMSTVTGGQLALLQGMRKIGDMARASIIGSILSTIASIGFYFFLGIRGIVPSLIAITAIQLFIAWFYTRRIYFERVQISWKESILNSGNMVRLGFVFMWNSLVVSGINFIIISLISQKLGIHSVGIYSAAFSLSGIFVNFILASMGTDYYPRLTSLSGDNPAMNREVNEQTEICLLLALPGLIATLTLAPWIIRLFYTTDFLPSVDLLRWFILGCFGRIVSWPLGFLILALGKKKYILFNESIFNILQLLMVIAGIYYFGLLGVALAFVIMYIGYTLSVYIICHRLTGFFWNKFTRKLLLYSSVILIFGFICAELMPIWPATILGLVISIISTGFSLRWLVRIIGSDHKISILLFKVPWVEAFCKRKISFSNLVK